MAKVDWFEQDVVAFFKDLTPEGLLAVGHQIQGQAQINIVENGQVDTGAMLNSGRTDRITDNIVHVSFQVEYAIWQEIRMSYLYKALDQVAGKEAEIAFVDQRQ